MQHSLVELFLLMGPFAKGIVLLLALMSLASLATGVERLLALRSAERDVGQVTAGLQALLASSVPAADRREVYDRALRSSLLATGASLRRGLSILATVGSTAPFVGLVGTVTGIINAFEELAHSQHAGIGMVSAGIAEALVTTAFGIGVAIPAVWLFNYLTHRIAALLNDMERQAQDLVLTQLRRVDHDL